MVEQWLQREKAKTPEWLQRDVEEKRRRWMEEKRRRMEEKRLWDVDEKRWWEEKKKRMEEKLQRIEEEEQRQRMERLRRMWDGELDLEPLIEDMGADSMHVVSIEPGIVFEDIEELSWGEQLLASQKFLREREQHPLAGREELVREKELQPLIGGMEADIVDVASTLLYLELSTKTLKCFRPWSGRRGSWSGSRSRSRRRGRSWGVSRRRQVPDLKIVKGGRFII